jgi:glutathione S-transferase
MSNVVVLHQFEISPFCQKVAKALRHKGIAFDAVDYNGMASTKAQMLSKVGKVPVLDIDGKRIQDSTKVARYLPSCKQNNNPNGKKQRVFYVRLTVA